MTERERKVREVLERADRVDEMVTSLLDELNEHVELLRAEIERKESRR